MFDPTLNDTIDAYADAWGRFLCARTDVPPGPIEVLDTDLATTVQADKLFRVNGAVPAVLHLELESSGHLGRPVELFRYNLLTHTLTRLPVHSVILLLRPKANASDLTGFHSIDGADARPYATFKYRVIRLWEESIDALLEMGPGLAALAMLTDEAVVAPEAAFARVDHRLRAADVPGNVREKVFDSMYILCGLRFSAERITELYRSVAMTLEDSTTYQEILRKGMAKGIAEGTAKGIAEGTAKGIAEGKAKGFAEGTAKGIAKGLAEGQVRGAQEVLLRQGKSRFGVPTSQVEELVRSVHDMDRLERMADRILVVSTWNDVLATL